MNKRIDVLAVMDRDIEEARKRIPILPPEGPVDADQHAAYEEAGDSYCSLLEARRSVANMIAVFDDALGWVNGPSNYEKGLRVRMRAALYRVRGDE